MNYSKYSLSELNEALATIDKDEYPERYSAIIKEIDNPRHHSVEAVEQERLDKEEIVQKWKKQDSKIRLMIISFGCLILALSELFSSPIFYYLSVLLWCAIWAYILYKLFGWIDRT